MKSFRGFSVFALVSAVLLLVSAQSEAGLVPLTTTLDKLLPFGNFTNVGNETFTFQNFTSNTTNGTAIAASAISVSALSGNSSSPTIPYGVEFTGGFSASLNNITNDASISFSVTSPTLINSVTLAANGSTTGTGFTNVTEQIFTLTSTGGEGTLLGQISVNGFGTATLNIAGTTGLYITKDILYESGTSGTAALSIVQQTFGQVVPEPASIVMVSLGLVAASASAFGRSRRKSVGA
jgi:hypothetical protein